MQAAVAVVTAQLLVQVVLAAALLPVKLHLLQMLPQILVAVVEH
jgi:hypothetical protein